MKIVHIIGILIISLLIIANILLSFGGNNTSKEQNSPIESNHTKFIISLGSEEAVGMMDLKYVPDGNISKIEKDNMVSLFVTAHDRSYILKGNSLNNLSLLTDSNGKPKAVMKPGITGFDKDYAGFGAVINNPVTGHLIGVYHAEQRVNPDASDTQISSIGVAISPDNGLTWTKKGAIIKGIHQLSEGTKTSGAGQPCSIIVGDYIYLYYTDWNYNILTSIHLARSPLASDGQPGSWEKYTLNGFGPSGLNGTSDAVIYPWNWEKTLDYTSNPSITYNTYLKRYLVVFESNYGFFYGTSQDGIHWGNYNLLFPFLKSSSIQKQNGDVWYSYPSLISIGVGNTQTSKSGYLYYGRGVFGQTHYMMRKSFTID